MPSPVPKERRDGKKSSKLPETPKTAEEMWQHSVIGDYLAKYRVSFFFQFVLCICLSLAMSSLCDPCWSRDWLQSDRRKAQAGMEAAWKSMEKKEKIPWIKKAAEDQKRYEVQC